MQKNHEKITNMYHSSTSVGGEVVVIALAMVLIFPACSAAYLQNQESITTLKNQGKSIVWDVTMNFINPTGQNDYVVFGEAPDAHDGPPADSYDVAKPPAPMPPYIRAYLKDNLPAPYTNLWRDYRHYPDSAKVWNLSVKWEPEDGESPTTITMSWSTADVDESEYTSVNLCTNAGVVLQNMLVNNTYTFSCPAYVLQNFKIICRINSPPVFGSSSPGNGSTGNLLSLTWSIPINDSEGNSFNWVIQCSNGQSANANGASNGTKSLSLSGLAYLTTYKVWVNATDPTGSGLWTKRWYTFTTMAQPWVNRPPTFSNPSPVNGSTGVKRYHATNVTVSDLDGNSTTVCFWYSLSSNPYSWVKAQQNNSVPANTTVRDLNSSYSSGWNTQYWWRVTAYDGHANSSVIYTFTTMAQPWVNRPPTFSNPSPVNGSTGVKRYHATNVTVSDLDGNSTTVCFWYSLSSNPYSWVKAQQNNSVPANTTVRDLNSSYSSGWNTQYWWRVTAYDGHANSSVIYTFTTMQSNSPPVFGTPSPVNGSTGNQLSFTWSIPINDPEGNAFSWTIQCNNGQTNSGSGATNGTKSLALSGLAYSTTYKVWVNATDPTGSGLYTRRWYSFTTKANLPPLFGTPSPVNGSTGNQLSFTWSIPINDPEGNTFSWTIQCNNGQTNSGSGATNGTKSLALSGLAYSTTYKVWVNATDPTGSGLYTRKWYGFTTAEEPNSPPAIPQRPSGQASGKINVEYTYTTITTDPNHDQIYYNWSWGDGTTSGWLGPYPSNQTVQAKHTWTKKGNYGIKVKAKDIHGAESNWSESLPITMPVSQHYVIGQLGALIHLLIRFIRGEFAGMTLIQLLRMEGWLK